MTNVELISRFENRTLLKSEWTHEAHLIVALWYCIKYDSNMAMELLREKIPLLNETHGTPNSESSGYHETITRFWVWQTDQYLLDSDQLNFNDLCAGYVQSNNSNKDAPFKYYSEELLFSKRARMEYVKPDKLEIVEVPKQYMIVEEFFPDRTIEMYTRFEKEGRMLPKGVKYINSWIDENLKVCYQLMESETIQDLQLWIEKWDDLAKFQVIPVINSKRAKLKSLITIS